ncbi:TetR/AcrR family transcriptional regulator [Streptomyces virginiae]|uniref:TetR/AcrR family transcriptional regulator n=1 Tax=Streptomyces virginiae TaxID=1961 RepID=UPI0036524250
MTDSKKVRRTSGKRERLVTAAAQVLHAQGVAQTTLADIAQAAEVPVGNVYYYFKTKDDLVEAAIDAHAENLRAMIASLDELPTPADRLKALLAGWVERRELTARYGCPTGTLASELDKRADGLDRSIATVMRALLDWVEQQFRAMGHPDAREPAVALIASYQGISLLTNTFRDPDLMTVEARRLERWIDSLAEGPTTGDDDARE